MQNTFGEQPDLPRYRLATPASLLCSMEANIFQRPQAEHVMNENNRFFVIFLLGGLKNFEQDIKSCDFFGIR